MKKLVIVTLLGLLPVLSWASSGHTQLDHIDIDLNNKASLQRGFKYFANYCFSCHGAAYSRFSRVGADLGISSDLLKQEFIFTRDEIGKRNKPGALMTVAMPHRYATSSFGTVPPDLSLVVRSRSADWVYTYLRSFYLDASRPLGVNNIVFPNVGMPHVLWELQGWQAKAEHSAAVAETADAHEAAPASSEEGNQVVTHGNGLYLAVPGELSGFEYNAVVYDIVNFMTYLSEPGQQKRKLIGFWVMGFLGIFFILAYLLKKEFWKDVH